MRAIGDINIDDNPIKYRIDDDINNREEENTHLEQSQDVDDNMKIYKPSKNKIDENMKDRDKSNTHTEESQDIDDNLNDDKLSKDVIDDHMKVT